MAVKNLQRLLLLLNLQKTGAYTFKEGMVHNDKVKDVVAAAQK
ncbi:DUF4295 family protein [Sphingobacterium multivorum]